MKATLILTAAFALATSFAMAQTVAPGTTPGAQTGNPSNMPSAGSPNGNDVRDKPTSTDGSTTTDGSMSSDRSTHANKRSMKGGSMKTKTKRGEDGTMKTKM